jgi:hypothetical protein
MSQTWAQIYVCKINELNLSYVLNLFYSWTGCVRINSKPGRIHVCQFQDEPVHEDQKTDVSMLLLVEPVHEKLKSNLNWCTVRLNRCKVWRSIIQEEFEPVRNQYASMQAQRIWRKYVLILFQISANLFLFVGFYFSINRYFCFMHRIIRILGQYTN